MKSKQDLDLELRKYASHIKDLIDAKRKGWATYLGDRITDKLIMEHISDYAKLRTKKTGKPFAVEYSKAFDKFI